MILGNSCEQNDKRQVLRERGEAVSKVWQVVLLRVETIVFFHQYLRHCDKIVTIVLSMQIAIKWANIVQLALSKGHMSLHDGAHFYHVVEEIVQYNGYSYYMANVYIF